DGSGGGSIDALGAGSIVLLENADLLGGTLTTSGGGVISAIASTLDGTHNTTVNIAGDVVATDGHTLTLAGTINNTGIIAIDASTSATTLSISGTVTLEGGGEVVLSDSSFNTIDGSAVGAVLDNLGNTIFGAGSIGGSDLTLTNEKAGIVD